MPHDPLDLAMFIVPLWLLVCLFAVALCQAAGKPVPYRDLDHVDAARDLLATGEDIYDAEYIPPHKPHPLPPVTGPHTAGAPAIPPAGHRSTGLAVEPSPRAARPSSTTNVSGARCRPGAA